MALVDYFIHCTFIISYVILSLNFVWNFPKKSISLSLSPLPALCLSYRDGPDQNSPQIGQFSGNTALESVYSTSNQILIKFHSDFTTSGFFVLSYHGWYHLGISISSGTVWNCPWKIECNIYIQPMIAKVLKFDTFLSFQIHLLAKNGLF